MERAAVQRRLNWETATVLERVAETPQTKSIVFQVPGWPGHRAGQHVDVRLTAEDGYQAERSYSIASGPEDDDVVLTVERLDDGEVSPYLTEELQPGDTIELRGPIGGYFVWEEKLGGPLFLLAGGSGVVPLRAMLRHYLATRSTVPVRLLYSARSLGDVIYHDELQRMVDDHRLDIRFTLTREQPPGWRGYSRRIDEPLLAEVAFPADEHPLVYICGPTAFAESAADALVALRHDPSAIMIERFGATGGKPSGSA
jgi:ferredoxin-NADP reductase